ncbi:MAG: SPFH/Band 7/PHB domain protein [Anaerolineae bacterium]|nr:SPFH/Band 7/PHB domain protein [Anaerolineae bacterium]
MGTFVSVVGGFIALLAVVLLPTAIKIVREYQRLVVFRLGKCIGERGPGLVLLIPFVDRPIWVDLREKYLEVPHQSTITRDNANISVDFLIYWKVVDPTASVVQVQNFAGASQGIATTTLRAVIGDIMLDDVLAQREHINTVLRKKLDEVTERWGNKVTAVEIREILPPAEIQSAMTRQMSAERTRRAVVTEAGGKKQATITVAEGDKQSAILRAEGSKRATILDAEGARRARVLNAEGYALALEKIFGAAKEIDSKTMSLQYLDALKALGSGASTKFILPMVFTQLLQPFIGYARESVAVAKGEGGGAD